MSVTRRDAIAERAADLFGSRTKAEEWFRRPNRALGNQTPGFLLTTPDGGDRVDVILGRIEHGLFS
jgi:putative toxin-antitoxin system antitoxin component (TIGR02293 family)